MRLGKSAFWTTAVPLVATAVLLTAVPAALAAPPPNDDFADAQTLGSALPLKVNGTNVEATAEPGEPSHDGVPAIRSIWYRWTPASSDQVAINVCDSDFRMKVAIYTGPAVDNLTRLTGTVQGHPCSILFTPTMNSTYHIAIDSPETVAGRVALSIRELGPPANDDFADAQDMGVSQFFTAGGDNFDATPEAGEPSHENGEAAQASVWYRWTAPETRPVHLDLCREPPPRFAVYTGDTLDSLTKVVDGADVCSRTFTAHAGTTYRLAIDGSGASAGGIRLWLRGAQPPANDDFDDAQVLPAFTPIVFQGGNTDATAEPGEPQHRGVPATKSVWYEWTAGGDAETTIDVCGSPVPTRLGIYTGASLATLTPVGLGPVGSACHASFDAVQGTTYKIAVDELGDGETLSASPEEGWFAFVMDGPIEPLVNDDFAQAVTVGPSLPIEVEGRNITATAEPGEPDLFPELPAGYSVWYRWTAPDSGPVIIDTCDSDFDPVVAVYTGSGFGSLSQVAVNDDGVECLDTGENEFGSAIPLNVIAGTTYRIAVDGWDEGTFALRVRSTGPQSTPTTPPTKLKCPKGKKPKGGKCVKKKKKKKKGRRRG
jgi:hypothetical protein